MALNKRNRIILAVIVAVVGVPLAIFFAMRENFFLMRFSQDDRLTPGQLQALDQNNPVYAEAAKKVAANAEETADSKTAGKMSLKADLDGDKKKDKLSGASDKVTIKLTKSRAKYRHRFIKLEKLASLGLDDLDNDGVKDAWFTLGNKGATYVLWSDGEGDISGKETLTWDNSGQVADAVRTAFFDVDKDGTDDLVIEKTAGEAQKAQYHWLKLSKGVK